MEAISFGRMMISNSVPKFRGKCEDSGESGGEGDIGDREKGGDRGQGRVVRRCAQAGDAIDKEERP